jgi:DNA-binding CsgD family transcriptional regulator
MRADAAYLLGRRSECEALDRLVADVLAGASRVAVLRGEAGVGKSALLGYLSERVGGWRVARAVGVESEMELAYSGLHQLCAPMLDHLERLPLPQRDALATVFGRSSGPAPDRFLVGLATLTLLAEVAEQEPLACIVDDAQWLDQASAQILAFVARRLLAERVALVCAVRTGIGDGVLAGLPELSVLGLPESDARALLLENVRGPLDAAVCAQIVAESHGNPLALLELPRARGTAGLAGGFGLPDSQSVPGEIEQSYIRRLRLLPVATQLLVLAAAAEPLGDPVLLHGAAEAMGVGLAAVGPAVDEGLLRLGARVEFAHPLVRSAAYRAAPAVDRQRVHRALAEHTDPEADPDRRAWHRARAAPGPDEEVAAELERSAGRAQDRGGLAAAAAFLQRAVALTRDATVRAERALRAAQTSLQSGEFDAARRLLAAAEAGPLDETARTRIDLLRGQIAFGSGAGSDAPTLLFKAASRLEPLDLGLARATYLDALCATVYIGPLDGGCDPAEVARAALAAARPSAPRPVDLLLDGVALLVTEGYETAAPTLRRALGSFDRDDLSAGEGLGWGWLACYIASALWEHETQVALARRQVQLAREAGAFAVLPHTLAQLVGIHLREGELVTAAALMHEVDSAIDATGSEPSLHLHLSLAAYQGHESEAQALIRTGFEQVRFRGGGMGVVVVQWASALLYNGLGRYEEALLAGSRAGDHAEPVGEPPWALPELVEAAARSGKRDDAADALGRLSDRARVSGTDWALGLEARSRALLAEGEDAELLYREALDRLAAPGSRVDLARAHLVYGEWLRREGRRIDAREQLHTAHDMLGGMGLEAFAERARRELTATGETVRKRRDDTRDQLTPQEEQIARRARDGLSNPEIGAELFLSARTVEWHLRKVYAKLGISSRRQLRTALTEGGRPVVTA